MATIYNLTKFCHASVIPQVRTITRYGTGSVILFNCAESPTDIVSTGDSVQTGSLDMFLSRFALSYGMTQRIGTEVLCVNMYIVTYFFTISNHHDRVYLAKGKLALILEDFSLLFFKPFGLPSSHIP